MAFVTLAIIWSPFYDKAIQVALVICSLLICDFVFSVCNREKPFSGTYTYIYYDHYWASCMIIHYIWSYFTFYKSLTLYCNFVSRRTYLTFFILIFSCFSSNAKLFSQPFWVFFNLTALYKSFYKSKTCYSIFLAKQKSNSFFEQLFSPTVFPNRF